MTKNKASCPICSRVLQAEKDLLVCSESHYSVTEKIYNDLWKEYAHLLVPGGVAVSTAFLMRLRESNLKNKKDG